MKIEPYLFFNGRCEEAIDFYKAALGAETTMLMRVSESPEPEMSSRLPPGSGQKIMHASLRIGDTSLMMSDGMCSGQLNFQGITLSLGVSGVAQAQTYFAALSQDGTVNMPLTKTFYSPQFGMVTDRFGVPWMVIAP
jgi:PhnB protein